MSECPIERSILLILDRYGWHPFKYWWIITLVILDTVKFTSLIGFQLSIQNWDKSFLEIRFCKLSSWMLSLRPHCESYLAVLAPDLWLDTNFILKVSLYVNMYMYLSCTANSLCFIPTIVAEESTTEMVVLLMIFPLFSYPKNVDWRLLFVSLCMNFWLHYIFLLVCIVHFISVHSTLLNLFLFWG